MRSKISDLAMALEGRFSSHHALMCRLHLDHIAHLEQMIARLDAQIETMMQPYRTEQDLLGPFPASGSWLPRRSSPRSARTSGPTSPPPPTWPPGPGSAPATTKEFTGKQRTGKRRHGNQNLEPVLAEAAWSAARHPGYLQSLYHRHVMKSGGYRSTSAKNKAIIVVAHAILIIVWHVLATGTPDQELGADYFDRRLDPERETRRLIAKLEALGHQVTLDAAV